MSEHNSTSGMTKYIDNIINIITTDMFYLLIVISNKLLIML